MNLLQSPVIVGWAAGAETRGDVLFGGGQEISGEVTF
jgi:hypothetical protein